ncbi:SDR family oxidoreductase [Blastococcus sp. CT_GayMR16]|nr:SDR family oxidoreductase [Blastococcus sp. CT_GayMR16]
MNGRTAVVTGGASGIGRAVVEALAGSGAHVAILDRDGAGAQRVAESLGEGVVAIEVDLTDRQDVAHLADAVEQALGPVSIVVNAAGWDLVEPFLDNSRDLWDHLLALNFMAPVDVSRVFLERMVQRDAPGRIVNIASDAGRVGSSGEVVYAGAKGGLIAFSKALARETARYGITVNAVCPGPTDTPLFRSLPDRMQAALIRAIPLRRLAQPDEVAAAVLFFASDSASFITGQVLSVSGGLTMAG